jgi:hypothetical protein
MKKQWRQFLLGLFCIAVLSIVFAINLRGAYEQVFDKGFGR